jgi:hypothetical protein
MHSPLGKPGKSEEICGAEVAFRNVGHLNQHLHTAHKTIAAALDEKTVGRKRVNPIAAMFAATAAAASPMTEVDDASVVDMQVDTVSLAVNSPIGTLPPIKRQYSAPISLSSGGSHSPRSLTLRQEQISSYIDAPNEPLNCIMMMIVMNGFPLSAIDNPYVKQAFNRVAASRYTLRSLMIRKHKSMKDELVKHLKQMQCAVSFVLDGWTNVSHSK